MCWACELERMRYEAYRRNQRKYDLFMILFIASLLIAIVLMLYWNSTS